MKIIDSTVRARTPNRAVSADVRRRIPREIIEVRSQRCRLRGAWLLLVLLLAWPAVLQAQFNYTTDNGTITITGYTGPEGSVVIPGTINGLPVTRIGDRAFFQCSSLTSVTIPNSVTSIGAFAFYQCYVLTRVTIPNSVTSIGAWAFSGCQNLTSVTIPNSVTSIGDFAFDQCTGLIAITVDPANPAYSSADGVLFDKSLTTLIQCPGAKAGSYAIPNSVTSIGGGAFSNCRGLATVTIPNSVTSIGGYAFQGCTGLTSITIPNRVSFIRDNAFSGCTGLTNVTIGNSVTRIGDYAFADCCGLTSVTIPSRVTNIGSGAFGFCLALPSVYFEGAAPISNGDAFGLDPWTTFFYRSGAAGWSSTYDGVPTAVWAWMPREHYADWAVTTGLTAQFPAANGESDDPDGDGFSNRDEWFAGTDPTQRASRLEMEFTPRPADLTASDRRPIPSGQHAVYFRSVPGRYYGVERATALGGAWELQAVRVADTSQTRFVLPKPEAHAFYRVLVLP